MKHGLIGVVKKSRLIAASAVIAASSIIVSVASFTQPSFASAACSPQDAFPETNIVYCGLDGSSAANAENALESAYNTNNDGPSHHQDIRAVMNATGFSSGMLTSGHWVMGTSYDASTSPVANDTAIVANGQVVAKSLHIASRCPNMAVNCSPSSRYTQLRDQNGNTISGVFTRDGNWFFDKDANGNPIHAKPTLVHLNNNGTADFALWAQCGNVLQFTSVTPPKSLQCVALTQQADSTLQYTFTAKASAQNETIQSYVFDFGDGTNQTVTTSATTTTSDSHTYTQTDATQNLTAKVSVNGSSDTGVTSSNCQSSITIPPKQKQQSLVCVNLSATPLDTAKTNYRFTATASATNTSITSYTFDFGDTNSQTVTTSSVTATADHQYDSTVAKTYTAQVTVSGTSGTAPANKACTTSVTITPQAPPTPPVLPNTGAGDVIGIFSLASVTGAAFYQFVLRKKIQA